MVDELIASGQAEPTEGQVLTHELVSDEKGANGMDRDVAAAEGEETKSLHQVTKRQQRSPRELFQQNSSFISQSRGLQKFDAKTSLSGHCPPTSPQYQSSWLRTCLLTCPRRNWCFSRRIPGLSQEPPQSCTGVPYLRHCVNRHRNRRCLPRPQYWSCSAGCSGGSGNWTGDSRTVPHQQIFDTGE